MTTKTQRSTRTEDPEPVSFRVNKNALLNSLFTRLHTQIASKIVARFFKEAQAQQQVAKKQANAPKGKAPPVVEATKSIWLGFPHSLSFYDETIKSLADPSMDPGILIDHALDWLPTVQPQDSLFSFKSFVARVASNELVGRQLDLVELISEVIVADILATYLTVSKDSALNAGSGRCEKLCDIFLAVIKPRRPRALEPPVFTHFRSQILAQWTIIFARFSAQVVSKGKALPDFIANPVMENDLLHRIRFLEISLDSNQSTTQSGSLFQKLGNQIFATKDKVAIRLQLQLFINALTSVNFHDKSALWTRITLEPKALSKLEKKDDEIELLVSKYQAASLAHGPSQNLVTGVEALVQKLLSKSVLVGKSALKGEALLRWSDEFLDTFLILMRGRMTPNRYYWLPGMKRTGAIEDEDGLLTPDLHMGMHHSHSPIVSQFSYAAFMSYPTKDLREKMAEVLRTIISALFGPKGRLSKLGLPVTPPAVTFAMQIAAHSKDLGFTDLFPTLMSSTVYDQTIATRALRKMLSGNFFRTAYFMKIQEGSDKLTTRIDELEGVPAEQLVQDTTNFAINFFTKSLKNCFDSLAGPIDFTAITKEEYIGVDCYLQPGDFNFLSFSPSSSAVSLDLSRLDKDVKSMLERVKKTISSTRFDRIVRELKRIKKTTAETAEVVEKWCGACDPPFSTESVIPSEEDSIYGGVFTEHRLWETAKYSMVGKKKRKDTLTLVLLKEVFDSYVILPGNFLTLPNSIFIGQLLLHPEEDISVYAAHFLQKIIAQRPELRQAVISSMVALIRKVTASHRYFLLQHLSFLLDLWASVWYSSESARVVPSFNSALFLDMASEVECLALENLCLPSPEIRFAALNVISTVTVLSHFFNVVEPQQRVQILLKDHEQFIIQQARYRLLLDISRQGADEDVKIPASTLVKVTILDVAGSLHERFWTYLLNYIGQTLIHYLESSRQIAFLRKLLLEQVALGPIPSSDVSLGWNNLYQNKQVLLFSTVTTKMLSPPSDKKPADAQPHPSEQMLEVLKIGWKDLVSDVVEIRRAKAISIGICNGPAVGLLIDSLRSWYVTLDIKKKPLARVSVASILRLMTDNPWFADALQDKAVFYFFTIFLSEFHSTFATYARTSSLTVRGYFNNSCIIANKFFGGLAIRLPAPREGPLRRTIAPASKEFEATSLFSLARMLADWAGLDQERVKMDQAEKQKVLVKIGEPTYKKRVEILLTKAITQMNFNAGYALESMAKVSQLIPLDHSESKSVDEWVIQIEQLLEVRLLKWVVSPLLFKPSGLNTILSKCYTPTPESSRFIPPHVIYSMALFDQFIPETHFPTNGVSSELRAHLLHRAKENEADADIGRSPLSDTDLLLNAIVSETPGKMVFVLLHYLTHPTHIVRLKAYQAIHYLGPIGFGSFTDIPEVRAVTVVREKITEYQGLFYNPNTSPECIKNGALAVSRILSDHIPQFSESLVTEAVARFKPLVSPILQKWVLKFLTPWMRNLNFAKRGGNISIDAASFLASFYQSITVEGFAAISPEHHFKMYRALVSVYTDNLQFLVHFFVSKGSTFDAYKRLVVDLAACTSKPTIIDCLTSHLTLEGVKKDSTASKPSAEAERLSSSQQLRRSCVLLLVELVEGRIAPFLPHLHNLFNYILLRWDSSEGPHVLKLFLALVTALHAQIKKPCEVDDPAELKLIRQDTVILENLELLLKENFLKLRWEGNTSNAVPSQSVFEPETLDLSKIIYNKLDFNNILEWGIQPLTVGNLVEILVRITSNYPEFQALTLGEQWSNRALFWVIDYDDAVMSTKALEIYLRLAKPSATGIITKFVANIYSTLNLLFSSVHHGAKGGLAGADKPRFSMNPGRTPGLTSESTTSAATQQIPVEQHEVCVFRTQKLLTALEIMISESTNVKLLLHIFWVCLTLINSTYPTISLAATKVLSLLLDLKQLQTADTSFEAYSKIAVNWTVPFEGLNKDLFQMLENPKVEFPTVELIFKWHRSALRTLVELQDAGKLDDPVFLLRLLPWILHHLGSCNHSPDGQLAFDDFTVGYKHAIVVLEETRKYLGEKDSKRPFYASIRTAIKTLLSSESDAKLLSHEKGKNRITFQENVCQVLHDAFAPNPQELFSVLIEMFHYPRFLHYLSAITNSILSRPFSTDLTSFLTTLSTTVELDCSSSLPELELLSKILKFEHQATNSATPASDKIAQYTKSQPVQVSEIVFRLGTLKHISFSGAKPSRKTVGEEGTEIDRKSKRKNESPRTLARPQSVETVPVKKPKTPRDKPTKIVIKSDGSDAPKTPKAGDLKSPKSSKTLTKTNSERQVHPTASLKKTPTTTPRTPGATDSISVGGSRGKFAIGARAAAVQKEKSASSSSSEEAPQPKKFDNDKTSVLQQQLKVLNDNEFDEDDLKNMGGTAKGKSGGAFDDTVGWGNEKKNLIGSFGVIDDSIAMALDGLKGLEAVENSSDYSSDEGSESL